MCFMLSGSQRSAIQYNRACCCRNWYNSLLGPQLLASLHAAVISVPSLPWEITFLWPLLDLCHGWQGRRSSSQGRSSFHYQTPAALNGGGYAAFLTLAEGICFISALFNMQSGLVRCQSAKLYYSSVGRTEHNFSLGCFFFFSFNHSLSYYYFMHHNKAVIYIFMYVNIYFHTLVFCALLQGLITAYALFLSLI